MTSFDERQAMPSRQAGDRHRLRRARTLAAKGAADGPQNLDIDFNPATLAGPPEPAAGGSDTESPPAPAVCQLMDSPSPVTLVHPWVRRHQFLTFVGLAYACSWTLWLLAAVGGGQIPLLIGGLGPMVAAAAVITMTGGSVRDWLRPVWRWRVPARWWAYALGLPALLYAVVSLVLQVTGSPVDWSLALARLPTYSGTFIFVLLLGGGLEEPGWRGFGLPLLQQRLSPVRATLLLGLVWGVWHVPLYGPAGFVVPMVLAFFYTVLWNRTHSLGLCILLHASFTPAQDQLILMARDKAYTDVLDAPDWAILGVYIVAVLALVALTRGHLGKPPTPVAETANCLRLAR